MIGLHINNFCEEYSDSHLNLSRVYGKLNVCVSYHSTEQRQVFFENDKYAVFIDGWIFNSKSYLKQAEFVLQEYLVNKLDLPYKLDGQFNICIVNKEINSFWYINDIFSFRKHYIFLDDKKVFLSSDIEFMADNLSNRLVNKKHLIKHLKMPRFIDVNETFYQDIQQVSPCTIINSIECDEPQEEKYSIDRVEKNYAEVIENIVDIGSFYIDNARYVHKTTSVLLELSGGLDSRFVIEILKESGVELQTITYGLKNSDEIKIAAEVARVNDVVHHEVNLTHDDFFEFGDSYISNVAGMDLFVQSCIGSVFTEVKKGFQNAVIDTGLYLDFLIGDIYSDQKAFTSKVGVLGPDEFCFKVDDARGEFVLNNRFFSSLAIRLSAHREYYDDRYSMLSYKSFFFLKSLPLYKRKNYNLYQDWSKAIIKNSFNTPLHNTMYGLELDNSLWDKAKNAQAEKEHVALEQFKKNKKVIYHNRYYSDFDMWLRAIPEWKEKARELLLSNDTRLNEYLDTGHIEQVFERHMSAECSHHSDLIKWMSLELFLRQSH